MEKKSENEHFILQLYQQPKTVFTIHEVAQLVPAIAPESLRDRLHYFTKIGKLKRVYRGIYAKPDYHPLELANSVYAPSYISLGTVLANTGVIFQHDTTIFAVSRLTKLVAVDGVGIQYRRIRSDILTNTKGIEEKTGYWIATRERAFLDAVYIYKNYHFDHLDAIDWKQVDQLRSLYQNRAFAKRLAGYMKLYEENRL